MRNVTFTPSNYRTANARAEIIKEIPVFSNTVLEENNNHEDPIQAYTAYDAEDSSSGITRVAIINGGYLAYQMFDDFDEPPDWIVSGFATIGRPGIYQDYIFYQTANYKVYRTRLVNGTLDTPVEIFTPTKAISIAPVSSTRFYYQYIETAGVKRIALFDTDTSYLWEGAVYGEDLDNDRFDAITYNGCDYIYTTETKSGRIVYLKNTNDIFGELKYVFALDVVDDTSMYRLECAKVINNIPIIVCQIKRTNGPSMTAYSFGPDEWSLGREMYITSELITYYGCIHSFDNKIIYMYPGKMHHTDDTDIFGIANSSNKIAIPSMSDFSFEMLEADASVSMNYPSSITGIVPGSKIVLYATIGGTEYTLFTGDVDVVSESSHESGSESSLHSRGRATKKLAQWQSDVSYDWWSQTKHTVTEFDYSKVTRVQGTWDFTDGVATQTDIARDGYLQLPSKACKDGQIKARFKLTSDEYSAFYGVGLHFYQLNMSEIEDALGEFFTEDQANLVRPNCMLALYGPSVHENGPGIGLYKVRAGVLTLITSVSHEFTYNIPHWLMLSSRDGNFKIYHAVDNASYTTDIVPGTWTEVIDYTYIEDEDLWKSGNNDDHVGRGVLFAASGSPRIATLEINSSTLSLPVTEDRTDFPPSGVLLIESEKISYSGGSGLLEPLGPYTTSVLGDDELVSTSSLIYNDNYPMPFGDSKVRNAVCQKIYGNYDKGIIKSIDVWVYKVGNPADALAVCLYTAPMSSSYPLGVLKERIYIQPEDVPNTPGFITVNFSGDYEYDLWKTYLIMHRQNWTVPNTENHYQTNRFRQYWDQSYTVSWAGTFNEFNDVWSQDYLRWIPMDVFGTSLDPAEFWVDGQLISIPSARGLVISPDITLDANYYDEFDYAYYTGFNDCVLYISSGAGSGNYTYIKALESELDGGLPDYTKVYVDSEFASLIGADSQLMICPTIHMVERGYDGTAAISHAAGFASVYTPPCVECSRLLYGSTEQDMTAGDVVRKIAGKVNIPVETRLRFGSSLTVSNDYAYEAMKKNAIIKLDDIAAVCGVYFSSNQEHTSYYYVRINGTSVELIYYNSGVGSVLVESFNAGFTITNAVISFQTDIVSVWSNDQLIYTFYVKDVGESYCGLYAPSPTTLTVQWEEADILVDNYILDMGTSAKESIASLLKEKKIFILNTYDGKLSIFTSYPAGPVSLNKLYSTTLTNSDGLVASRIRVEGGDIYELIDEVLMAKYGNIFRMVNSRETYDLDDTRQFAEATAYEMGSMSRYSDVSMPFDPRLEPFDIITINNKDLIIESISISFSTDYESFEFYMTMRCRWPTTELN